MTGVGCYSVSSATWRMLDELVAFRRGDMFSEVSLLAPTPLLCRSINMELLKRGPMLNVHVETPMQHILRRTESEICDKGGLIERGEMAGIFNEIFRDHKSGFTYFGSLDEFSSYSWIFADCLLGLRLNIPPGELIAALNGLESKGADLAKVASEYLRIKGSRIDYADAVGFYRRSGGEHIIAYPKTTASLSKHEREALGSYSEPKQEETVSSAETCVMEALTPTQEVLEAFRSILRRGIPLDRAVLICPEDYLPAVFSEADAMDIPIRTNMGEPKVLKEGLLLLAFLDTLISNYGFKELKELFYLQKQYGWVYILSRCGISEGREALFKAMDDMEADLDQGVCAKIRELLTQIESLSPLTCEPARLTEKIIARFELGKNTQNIDIIRKVCEDLKLTDSNLPLNQWRLLLHRRIGAVRTPLEPPGKDIGALLVTSDQMPGTFEDVFCLGLTERIFPRSHREGPLLLDKDIEQLNSVAGGNLLTSRRRNQRESVRIKDLVGAATRSWTASYPILDLISGKAESKSPYLSLLGIQPQKVNRLPGGPEKCISEQEWVLFNLETEPEKFIGYWASLDSGAKAHLELEDKLWNDINPGLIGDISALPNKPERDRFSPSQLCKLVECPFKWLVEKIYSVIPLEEPESSSTLSALKLGNLVHSILEHYLLELIAGKVKLMEARQWLTDRLERELSTLAANLGHNADFFINRDRNSLFESIENYLKYEESLPPGRKPISSELTFGHTNRKCKYDDPVMIDIRGIRFRLQGSIDRIDRDETDVWIIDYKNSKRDKYTSKDLTDLRYLQPLLYCAALENLEEGKGAERIFAGFFPLISGGDEYVAEYTEDAKAHLAKVMVHVFNLFKLGWFPLNTEAVAGGDPCKYCKYAPVCGSFKHIIAPRHLQKGGALRPEFAPITEVFQEFKNKV